MEQEVEDRMSAGTGAAPIFYTAEVEFPGAGVEAFIDWFSGRHAADLFKAGFSTCACYRALEGEYTILDVYQAASWDVFTTEEYAACSRDNYATGILAHARGHQNTVYEYLPLPVEIAGDPLAPIDADWFSSIRFDIDPEAEDRLVAALAGQEAPRLRGMGAETVRLVRRTRDRPAATPSRRPRYALTVEWRDEPPPLETLLRGLDRFLAQPLGARDGFVGVRVFPWPNRPHLLARTT